MVKKVAHNIYGDYVKNFRPSPPTASFENNFTGGLKTEFTGLNFPENACTQTENCVFTITGEADRRGGFGLEDNAQGNIVVTGGAFANYRWKNAGGDGETELLVQQVKNTLYFYRTSAAGATGTPISSQLLAQSLDLNSFATTGSVTDTECQFADGNGYLFVFNPQCEPFYVTYNPSSTLISSAVITVSIRDLLGVIDGLGVQGDVQALTTRPPTLSNTHDYNLQNQGWTDVAGITASSTTHVGTFSGSFNQIWTITGNTAFTVQTGLAIAAGQTYTVTGTSTFTVLYSGDGTGGLVLSPTLSGTVVSYNGGTGALVINIVPAYQQTLSGAGFQSYNTASWTFKQTHVNNTISTWFTAISNYPSNADIWWEFKNTSNVFAPTTSSILNVTLPNTQAPSGHFILNAFDMQRDGVSGISGLTDVTTTKRPSTGAWFAGRVWYAGVNDTFVASGNQSTYPWSENIYYSQVVFHPADFGNCYSSNDPTDETFFDPLSTDGGVITIPGIGFIHKLFVINNGLLVMADNGIWIITGSGGVGFDSTSYVVAKISGVRVLSASSIVDIQGLPIFWNLEGIYAIESSQQGANIPYGHGGLNVSPLTVGTILSFYNSIPHDSKVYARGAYNPITYVIQWVYRTTQETGLLDRYVYDGALNLNIYNKAFYPYTIDTSTWKINGITFMDYPSNPTELIPQFKYSVIQTDDFTYAEENDFTTYLDWGNVDFTSTFTTGYKLHGQGYRKWQPLYVLMYLKNDAPSSYTIQGIWDFNKTALGRTSQSQTIVNTDPAFGMLFRRHKLRGHGMSVQFKVNSVTGEPFSFMGWAVPEVSAVGA